MNSREILNVQFFVKWLNTQSQHVFAIDNTFNDQDSSTDVQIKNENGIVTKIQNVAYRDGDLYGKCQTNNPNLHFTMVIGTAMSPTDRTNSILKTINSKRDHYPKELVEDMILLIEVTIPSITPKDIEKLPQDADYGFKGVYFVCLPVELPNPYNKYDTKGYVYALKAYDFNNKL